jgi:wobble nucleotide-excising tRNase
MIKKILKIKNVGRFRSFSSRSEDLAFCGTTVIFGYNTYGKSTLTSIFRSLKENNPHYVHGRKTFGSSENQEVEILDSNNTKFVFSSNWEDKNIEIFDNNFISKNVFYGDYINKEQQSSLYGILIGDEIYIIKQNIDKAKESQEKLEKVRDIVERRFARRDFGTFEEFLKLKEEVGVENRIKEIQDEIKQQENLDNLKALISRTPLKSNFEDFKTELTKTLDLSVEKAINEHIEKHWKDTHFSKDFLGDGLDLIKEDGGCIFCGQSLSGVTDFISQLRKVFSEEYKNLKKSIKVISEHFISIDLEKIFLEFEKYGLNIKEKLDYARLKLVKENLDKKVRAKQNDLSINLDLTIDTDFSAFLVEIEKLSETFKNITNQPSSDTTKLLLLKKELKKQELTKYRFSEEGISIFNDYNTAEKNVELEKEGIKKLNAELTEKVNKIFQENEKQINTFLKELGANFILKDFAPKSHMGLVNTHFCDYKFVIDSTYVVQVSNKTRKDDPEPENIPHFKNTLSDSDRRLLAFAFYLAKLKNDNDIQNKIIVLDDPFSSFDDNRKEETVKLLTNIKNTAGNEPAQKIIFTHDKGFLCRLFKKLPSDSKVLKIHYSTTNGSELQLCDVENDFLKDDYFKDIEYIKNSVENSVNIDEALKKIRLCLEHVLKRKYYFLLSRETIHKKSVGDYLKEIDSACPKKDEILSESWHEDMHDGHQMMQLNEPAKIAKLARFLELIREI